jgi:hypothetical protein
VGIKAKEKHMKVKPKKDIIVLNEATDQPLPAEKYTEVPKTIYYLRRIADGDLTVEKNKEE